MVAKLTCVKEDRMKTPKDSRDELIKRLTKSIADLITALRSDPAWFELGPDASKAVFVANQVKHEGAAHCYQNGLTLEGEKACSI